MAPAKSSSGAQEDWAEMEQVSAATMFYIQCRALKGRME